MASTNDVYTSYHAMSAEITEGLSQMAKICQQLDLNERADSLLESRKKLQEHKFAVGILGEFKRGKSTVINSLLGQEIMPADITPCSATMNRVTYDLTPRARVNMMDGSPVDIPVEELAKYVTKLDEESEAMSEKVEEAVVYYPCRFCQNGVDIVDTPGLNDDERMNKITEEIVPKLDAVIMVLVADNPFSMSEAEFVRNKLMCSDVGRLIFLVNKIDTVRPKDREKAVNGIRDKIQKTVLEKTEDVYGMDSDQYRAVKAKLADIRIYPISAMNALDGRMEGDEQLLKKSGALEFEAALSHMLTEERGILELSAPMMKLISMGPVVSEVIDQKISCMELDAAEFLKAQQDTAREIRMLREEKQEEKKKLSAKSKNLREELAGKAELCYQEIESSARHIVDSMNVVGNMSESDKQKLISDTLGKIKKKNDDILAVHSERLITELNTVVQKESQDISAELLGKGSVNLNQHLSNISLRNGTNAVKNTANEGIMQMAAIYIPELLTGSALPIFGIGSAIEGYRAAGAKGLLVGGASGLAIGVATMAAFSGAIVGLPLGILCAATSTLGGNAIVRRLFAGNMANRQLEGIKQDLKQEVINAINQMRLSRILENWIQAEVGTQYEKLISMTEEECEKVIEETQRKITAISQSLTATKTQQEAQRRELMELNEETTELLKKLEPVYKKLLAVPTVASV